MTKRSKFTVFAFLAAFSLALLPLSLVRADETTGISAERISNIEVECNLIKDTLNHVKNSDKNTRVSIGRSFQSIYNDFITPLNVRFVKNNDFNVDLNDLQGDFVNAREDFNRKYIEYNKELESLIATDCKNEPEGFYRKLNETRKKRAEVAKSVEKVKTVIEKHVETVKKLRDGIGVKDE